MDKAKSWSIPKLYVWDAYKRVKANRGAAGVDDQTIEEFERELANNLYKLWNRMSSGSYFPPPVKRVNIEKRGGGSRPLGIPTVADRALQRSASQVLSAIYEQDFLACSFGGRPGRGAHQALATLHERIAGGKIERVLEADLKNFLDRTSYYPHIHEVTANRLG